MPDLRGCLVGAVARMTWYVVCESCGVWQGPYDLATAETMNDKCFSCQCRLGWPSDTKGGIFIEAKE